MMWQQVVLMCLVILGLVATVIDDSKTAGQRGISVILNLAVMGVILSI